MLPTERDPRYLQARLSEAVDTIRRLETELMFPSEHPRWETGEIVLAGDSGDFSPGYGGEKYRATVVWIDATEKRIGARTTSGIVRRARFCDLGRLAMRGRNI